MLDIGDVFDGVAGDLPALEFGSQGASEAIDLRSLSLFHRALLVTDGTVTKLLEVSLLEPIRTLRLSQERVVLATEIPELAAAEKSDVVVRRVLLVGRYSQQVHAYAESILVLERLGPELLDILERPGRDLGRAIREARLETYREVIRCGREPVGDLRRYLGDDANSHVLSRTYRVIVRGRPAMLITEKFPAVDPTATHRAGQNGERVA